MRGSSEALGRWEGRLWVDSEWRSPWASWKGEEEPVRVFLAFVYQSNVDMAHVLCYIPAIYKYVCIIPALHTHCVCTASAHSTDARGNARPLSMT